MMAKAYKGFKGSGMSKKNDKPRGKRTFVGLLCKICGNKRRSGVQKETSGGEKG